MKTRIFIVVYEDANRNINTEHVDAITAQYAVDLIRKWQGDSVFIRDVYKEVRNWK